MNHQQRDRIREVLREIATDMAADAISEDTHGATRTAVCEQRITTEGRLERERRMTDAVMKAKVVYERQDAFDMHSGPYGYERVGFAIGDRVFWTGCVGSGLPSSSYVEDKTLAETIVERWNAVFPPEGA